MNYKNEKLNIEIIDNVFEIKEHTAYIELYFNEKLMYDILPNSKVLSTVLDSGDISIETYNNSRITAYGKSLVASYDNSRLEVCDSTKVISFDNSVIKATGKSAVTAFKNSEVEAREDSTVKAWDHAKVEAYNNSRVEARDIAMIVAKDNSLVIAYDCSKIKAKDDSTVILNHSSTAEIWGCSKATMYDEAIIDAHEFSTIYVRTKDPRIKTYNYFGAIIGQVFKVTKPIKVYKKLNDNLIATLELSKGQIFQSEEHDKCRTDRALVVAIESKDKSKSYKRGVSQYDSKFVYEVGKEAVADKYYSGISECSHGIHFFLNRKSAEEY